jgi:formate/nitrite transporter FocA (FNT family)
MARPPSADQSRKAPDEILSEQISEGLTELRRPSLGLSFSALSAGLDIGFGPLMMAVTLTMASGELPKPILGLLTAAMYSVGFLFVVLGRSELFTEHTTLAVLPVLDGRASVTSLARLWGIVYTANLIGGALFAAFASYVGLQMGVVEVSALEELAKRMVDHEFLTILLAAVLAGWLMGLLTWLVTAAQDTVGRVLIVTLVTAVIGFAHLPHVIAGNVEVLMGLFAGADVTLADYGTFLLASTLGNIVGGTVFVGLLKYAHAIRQSEGDPEQIEPGTSSSSSE